MFIQTFWISVRDLFGFIPWRIAIHHELNYGPQRIIISPLELLFHATCMFFLRQYFPTCLFSAFDLSILTIPRYEWIDSEAKQVKRRQFITKPNSKVVFWLFQLIYCSGSCRSGVNVSKWENQPKAPNRH